MCSLDINMDCDNVMGVLLQLTDFGLSRVGLINSTDDLSGPAASGNRLMEEAAKALHSPESSQQREKRQERSAIGTPDYLAPEILLGTSHGKSFHGIRSLFEVGSTRMFVGSLGSLNLIFLSLRCLRY